MKTKVAVLTDLHFFEFVNQSTSDCKGEFADILLLRAIHRFNRYIKPDLVFISDNLIKEPECKRHQQLLSKFKNIIDLLEAPVIIVSDKHNQERKSFEDIIDKQPDFVDINGIRFVPFFDQGSPYNAFRPKDELSRMRKLGTEFDGPLVSLQHMPLFPPASAECPYNYTNADKIIEVMRENGYLMALSGHYHHGFEQLNNNGLNYLAGGALCKIPFEYTIVEIDAGGKISCLRENLAMPSELGLVDHHVHTRMAYCNENMDIPKSIAIAKLLGLEGIVISEHSSHLYFNQESYMQRMQFSQGLPSSRKNDRTAEYFAMYATEADDICRLGMEVDYDCRGKKVIEPDIWSNLQFRNGAVHILKSIINKSQDTKLVDAEFLFLTEAITASEVDVLAHPFRVFGREGLKLPRHLFGPTIDILKRYGTAVEINYHTNEPSAEFFYMCIENGIKLSLGSDAHNLYEVGEFYPHLKFLHEIAPDYDLNDLLK